MPTIPTTVFRTCMRPGFDIFLFRILIDDFGIFVQERTKIFSLLCLAAFEYKQFRDAKNAGSQRKRNHSRVLK